MSRRPFGKPDDVQRGDRVGAHRVDVAQRVGRGNLSEHVGVVHDRREEIDGVDDRQVRPQTKHSRIVGRLGADNHIGVIVARQLAQHVRQVGRAELGRSTGGGDLLGQSRALIGPCVRRARTWRARSRAHAVSVSGLSQPSHLADPDREAGAIEVFEQRNRVLARRLVAIAELGGRDPAASPTARESSSSSHPIDAVAEKVQVRRDTNDRSLAFPWRASTRRACGDRRPIHPPAASRQAATAARGPASR